MTLGKPGALSAATRDRLEQLVATRRGAAIIDNAAEPPSRFAAMTDFATLPGYQEIQAQRAAADLLRTENPFFKVHAERAGARTVIDGRTYDNFSSYDYLGLNQHPAVAEAAKAAIDRYGTSPSASRLVAGERPIHEQLERKLAQHYGQQAALTFVSGHATNVSTIASLVGPRDLVVHDALAHNSIIMGGTLSRAERRSFPHNDLEALNDLLSSMRARFERVLIVVEGLYSMDGDCPDLRELVAIKQRHGAWLMVDDAHGLGVIGPTGRGLFERDGVDPRAVDIWMGTLSKTLASCGGYVAGCAELVDYLRCTTGSFVYSVGLPPAMAGAAIAAIDLLHGEPERVGRLQANGALFCRLAQSHQISTGDCVGAAVVPVMVPESLVAVVLSQKLFERGINVQPIIHPAVPERKARLRFFISSEHDAAQIGRAVATLAEEMRLVGDTRAILRRLT